MDERSSHFMSRDTRTVTESSANDWLYAHRVTCSEAPTSIKLPHDTIHFIAFAVASTTRQHFKFTWEKHLYFSCWLSFYSILRYSGSREVAQTRPSWHDWVCHCPAHNRLLQLHRGARTRKKKHNIAISFQRKRWRSSVTYPGTGHLEGILSPTIFAFSNTDLRGFIDERRWLLDRLAAATI